MIPISVPNVGEKEERNLLECIKSTMVSTAGPFVGRFESALAQLCGTPGAVSTSTGTAALHAALVQEGVGHNDLVIAPSLTFIATANAISHCGARPWLFDCDAQTWTLDLDLVRQTLLEQTQPHPQGRQHRATGQVVKAIMPVMTMGLPLDFEALGKLRDDFGLRVVVDAAAAIGGRAADKLLGEAQVDALCFSFNGNKTITCGGGGAIVSSSPERLAALRHLTTTGRTGRDYDHDVVAFNYRMTNVSAAIGLAQLERLPEFLETKAKMARLYTEFAATQPELAPFPTGAFGQSTYWFSGFHYKGMDKTRPDAFRQHMQGQGIDLRKFWKPVHQQAPYAASLKTDMTNCEDIWQRVFCLPCSTNITDAEIEHVLRSARDFWSVS